MAHEFIETFLKEKTFDIRVTGNGRWIDQKCTYDVVNFVADCIAYYLDNGGTQPFQSPDIWRSAYAVSFVQDAFGKPYPLSEEPHDEFNKFFRQPIKMLAAAEVLREDGKRNNTIQFSVIAQEMLEYLALRPLNALWFLQAYIEKTLRNSGLWPFFERFFALQTKEAFKAVKDAFEQFCYDFTPIKNKAETGRIFAKVLNPLAFERKSRGTERGQLSPSIITLSDITYNRPNWRDRAVKKDKNVARRSFVALTGDEDATREYLVRKAMKLLKQFNRDYRDSKSEVVDLYGMGEPATQAHHLFPKHQFPEIADYSENIIMLTSAQHFEKAHPNGQTREIDLEYQYVCLCSKVISIRDNMKNDLGIPVIYDFRRLVAMLNRGFSTDFFSTVDEGDFDGVMAGLALQYPPSVVKRSIREPKEFDSKN